MKMPQYFVRTLDGCVCVLDGAFSSIGLLQRALEDRTGVPASLQSLSCRGCRLPGGCALPSARVPPGSVLQLHLLLPGGKGGFGANLRAQGRTATKRTTTTFKYCRDLNGRRLQSVNDEARLKAWLSREETHKRSAAQASGAEYEETSGPSGLAGWHLGVPNWAEGVGGKSGGWKRPQKTQLCKDWMEARGMGPGGGGAGGAGRRMPPPGAPRSWGCPRGRQCGFAHGEEELRGEGKLAAAAANKELAQMLARDRLAR